MADIKYEKAMEELNEILTNIDNQDIKIDDLVNQVKRGAELIKLCKKKLMDTEMDVNTVLEELESSFKEVGKEHGEEEE